MRAARSCQPLGHNPDRHVHVWQMVVHLGKHGDLVGLWSGAVTR
jgi:hypothetical protein